MRLVERAAADFLSHFPALRADTLVPGGTPSVVLVGSERGFCGAFNEQLLQALDHQEAALIAIGRKLYGKLGGDARLRSSLDGATVAEETETVIADLTRQIRALEATTVVLLFHDETEKVQRLSLLPPFRDLPPPSSRLHCPPALNMPAAEFYGNLVEHYVFALLHLVLFSSLLAENQQRVRHLEGAVQRLDEQSNALERRSRQLRQEEITEEIEVILLNAGL